MTDEHFLEKLIDAWTDDDVDVDDVDDDDDDDDDDDSSRDDDDNDEFKTFVLKSSIV